ncbi:UNVERIFIED_CONTAM: DNA-processing protein DprA [Campylobacter lari]
MNDLLLYFSFLYKGNNYLIYKALKDKKSINLDEINQIKQKLAENQIKYLTIYDELYPKNLKFLTYAPFVIYYKGNLDLLKNKTIMLTGDNKDNITLDNLNDSLPLLVNSCTLVTNSFKNLDTEIIKYYKKAKKGIIYVLASGHLYPDLNCKSSDDLIISIYPLDTHPKLNYFKERNVISACLAENLIIYNSNKNSGILNLANIFASLGKEIYCYPGFNYDDGNTFLIKSGANLITKIGEVKYY